MSMTQASVEIWQADALDDPTTERLLVLVNKAYSKHSWLFPNPRTTLADYQEEIAGHELLVLLSEPNRQIIGTALIYPTEDGLYLGLVAVDPDRQGQGLGGKLLAAIEQIARERGFEKLWLYSAVEVGNAEYYAKRGFQITKTTLNPLGTWGSVAPYHTVVMVKKL